MYVFTKALGEMLIIQEKGDIPLVILRPTIVTSTFKEPFPGWVEGVRYSFISAKLQWRSLMNFKKKFN